MRNSRIRFFLCLCCPLDNWNRSSGEGGLRRSWRRVSDSNYDENRLTGTGIRMLTPAPAKHAVTGAAGKVHDFLYPAFLSSSQIFLEMKFQAITNTVAATFAAK